MVSMSRSALLCASAIPVTRVAAPKMTPVLLQPRSNVRQGTWSAIDQVRFWLECKLDGVRS
jgi:hypothetical protein